MSPLPYCGILCVCLISLVDGGMTKAEKRFYRDKVIGMFFHAYDNYMEFAYPADELMPLSCRGRVRGREPSRGDIDDCLGSFSLTLIDSLDTLAVIGAIKEFSEAIKLVIRDVRFNADLKVSVFETNIRVLGGLLGGHFAAEALRDDGHPLLQWYNDELVSMAKTVGDKLLPAFNTSTGLPYGRINLRHGAVDKKGLANDDSTCTACAGTLLMEFGALSRLTGDQKYELKASVAMEALWDSRHHTHNLLGTVINIHNKQWLKKESGVGAGSDSYYEYCLKSYILFGDKKYLKRFNAHYSAIKQYVSDGPNLFEVNMNSPTKTTRRFMDSLLAFWPGLQVLWGDIASAVETHNMLYQATLRNKFLPEAFSPEFKAVWPQHPLRPEFVESTYFLYQATDDPYYLDIGRSVVENLEKYAWVPCGYAAFSDLKRSSHEDRFDSYVLAETFKYLFLLFAEKEDLSLDMEDFVFTTEAHILPLKLSNASQVKPQPKDKGSDNILPSQCPLVEIPWADVDVYRKLLNKQCNGPRSTIDLRYNGRNKRLHSSLRNGPGGKVSLKVLDFGNPTHLMELNEMGITFQFQDGGKVMLAHRPETATSKDRVLEGKLLMQEIIKMMGNADKNNSTGEVYKEMRMLSVIEPTTEQYKFIGGPAMFGPSLGGKTDYKVEGQVMVPTSPVDGCGLFDKADGVSGKIPIILRGGCMFVDKVRHAESSGAVAVIIYDNARSSTRSVGSQEPNSVKPVFPFTMSGDGVDDIHIPALLISREDGMTLRSLASTYDAVRILLSAGTDEEMRELHEAAGKSEQSPDQSDSSLP